MCFGYLLSTLFNNQADAMQCAIGSFYPMLLLSGILWPLGTYLKKIAIGTYIRSFITTIPNYFNCFLKRVCLKFWEEFPGTYHALLLVKLCEILWRKVGIFLIHQFRLGSVPQFHGFAFLSSPVGSRWNLNHDDDVIVIWRKKNNTYIYFTHFIFDIEKEYIDIFSKIGF